MSSNLGIALEKAGITRIVLVRHANAAPWGQDLPKKGAEGYPIHSWQRDDQMRPLTDKGKQQAAVAREWFLRDISLAANKMIITSGAQRASQTAQVFIEQQVKKKGMLSGLFCTGGAEVRECTMNIAGSLHPAGIAPKCEELFDTHGYAPLAKFYAMDGGEAAFAEYAEIVAAELCKVASNVSTMPGDTLSLFGHAVFLNAVAMMLCRNVWGADEATITSLTTLELLEAEAIVVENVGGKCSIQHKTVRPHPLWQ